MSGTVKEGIEKIVEVIRKVDKKLAKIVNIDIDPLTYVKAMS